MKKEFVQVRDIFLSEEAILEMSNVGGFFSMLMDLVSLRQSWR